MDSETKGNIIGRGNSHQNTDLITGYFWTAFILAPATHQAFLLIYVSGAQLVWQAINRQKEVEEGGEGGGMVHQHQSRQPIALCALEPAAPSRG